MKQEFRPIAIGAWIDFILAAAAHRSSNPGQQKLGQMLLDRYFTALPDSLKDDPVATAYFNDTIPAVAAAIRGFSVARDIFQTKWNGLRRVQEQELKVLDMIDSLAPLRKDGLWGKLVALLAGIGLVLPFKSAFGAIITKSSLAWLCAIAAGIAAGVIALTVIVQVAHSVQAKRIENKLLRNLTTTWQRESLEKYRAILEVFIVNQIETTNRHYPESVSEISTSEQIRDQLNRHMSFRVEG